MSNGRLDALRQRYVGPDVSTDIIRHIEMIPRELREGTRGFSLITVQLVSLLPGETPCDGYAVGVDPMPIRLANGVTWYEMRMELLRAGALYERLYDATMRKNGADIDELLTIAIKYWRNDPNSDQLLCNRQFIYHPCQVTGWVNAHNASMEQLAGRISVTIAFKTYTSVQVDETRML